MTGMIDLTHFAASLQGKPVAVFGLARSGLSALKALRAAGVTVYVGDDHAESVDKAVSMGGIPAVLDSERLRTCACLIPAPGVPLHFPAPHPVVTAARSVNIPILGDIEVLHRTDHGRTVVGITGTNGKSTTTAIIDHVLCACGVPSACGGNIGKAVFDLDAPPPGGAFVLELSSYQLDLCDAFSADIAVLLNITPDHLDRHGSMENYVAAKARIFKGARTMIVAADLLSHRAVAAELPAGLQAYDPSVVDVADADTVFFVVNGEDYITIRTAGSMIYDTERDTVIDLQGVVSLPGAHNMQNAAAAYAAARALGCSPADIQAALRTYPGLEHRQYPVRTIGEVLYVNDTKATNAQAAGKALSSYEDIYWIAGGRMKAGGLKGLDNLMPRVHHAFLIGEAADDFAAFLKAQGVPHTQCGVLDNAVAQAHDMAQNAGKGVVLLSPACSSFDQFVSFDKRGDLFVDLVRAL